MKIDARDKKDRLEQFEKLCRETRVPCTIQRRALLEAVLARDDHPTANQIFEAVSVRNQGISRATVHRNLEIMSEVGCVDRHGRTEFVSAELSLAECLFRRSDLRLDR